MARVAFLSLVFPPDSVSTAQMMGELAADLKSFGHEVTVLTTSPHYNRDPEAEAKQPLHNCWGTMLRRSSFDGIPVYHVSMPKKGANVPARLLSWLNFHILSTIAGLFVLSRPDVLIVPSPPLTIGLSAWLLALFHRGKYIYNVQEIYPDYAIRVGAIRNNWLIGLLYGLESFVYKKAAAITVIAPRMAQQLVDKGVPVDKVRVIPNFVDIVDMYPLSKTNDFSRQHHICDKFVVTYAGNMGPGQDLENFIDSAAILKEHPHIHFMMMGDGMLRAQLKARVADLDLPNFTFLPHQPYSLVPQIYAASDLCLVPQSPGITETAIPSKVYRIMACARPVLASTVLSSDLADLIDTAHCGIVVEAGSPQRLAAAILQASKDPELIPRMGNAGRVHVVESYSREAVSRLYCDLVEYIVGRATV